MKHLKLYEAFESLKLSKVFNYLNATSKQKFIDELKSLCHYFDYPISKLSDDNFKYLSFKKAYNLNTSGDGGIQMIKFWFTKDGSYVTKSAITGKSMSGKDPLSKTFSRDINNYVIGKSISVDDLGNLPVGTKIRLSCSDGVGPAYLYKHRGRFYMIQSFAQGSRPEGDDGAYTEIARYSWVVDSSSDYNSLNLIYENNYDDGSDAKGDIFNLGFDIRNKEKIDYYPMSDISLIDCNFALILDVSSLSEISLDKIKNLRSDRKKGAFLTDEEIKNQNIKRYVEKIMGVGDFISNPDRLIKKFLGKMSFVQLESIGGFSNITELMKFIEKSYYEMMSLDEGKELERLKDYLRNEILNSYDSTMVRRKSLMDNISRFKNDISQDEIPDKIKGYLRGDYRESEYRTVLENADKQLDMLFEIGEELSDKLSGKIENIYDIESVHRKLASLRKMIDNRVFNDGSHKIREYLLRHIDRDYDTFLTVLLRRTYNEPDNFLNKSSIRIREFIKRL